MTDRRPRLRPLHFVVLALALGGSPRAQTIVVETGDDLAAIVSQAPRGATVEVRSNETFLTQVEIVNKDLVLEAGPGFRPRLFRPQGEAGAALFIAGGVWEPEVRIRGIDIGSLLVSSVQGFDSGPLDVEFDGLSVLGRATVLGGTGGPVLCRWNRCSIGNELRLEAGGAAELRTILSDCVHLGATEIVTFTPGSNVIWGSRRSLHTDGVEYLRIGGAAQLLAVSSVFRWSPGGTSSAFDLSSSGATSDSGLLLTNCTITGFELGLDPGKADVLVTNGLMFGNDLDVPRTSDPNDFSHCLFATGVHAGVNGNLAATPLVDGEFRLLASSPGRDAGTWNAPLLGVLDRHGDPRVADADGDGVARPNVGATEGISAALPVLATETIRLGAPPNPQVLTTGLSGPPLVGRTWSPRVDHATWFPGATLDVLVLARHAANDPTPFAGTLLVDLSQISSVSVIAAGEPFHLEVPAPVSFVGLGLSAQAATLDGFGQLRLTNALDLILGVF